MWDKIKKHHNKDNEHVQVEHLIHDHGFKIRAGPLLDMLNVNDECCRTFIITRYKSYSAYNEF